MLISVLIENGDVYCFGLNEKGQAGLEDSGAYVHQPKRVNLPDKAYSIAAGAESSIAVTGKHSFSCMLGAFTFNINN